MEQQNISMPALAASPKKLVGIVAVAALIYLIFSSYYTVSAESVGIVQRFGHYHDVVDPGLHFKVPFGVDTVTYVPVKRQLKEEFGFATEGATYKEQV